MYNIYFACFTIGLGLLALNVLLTGINDLFEVLSFFDFHFDVSSSSLSGFLPLSPLELCAFATAFGSIGVSLYERTPLHLIFAILAGLLLSYSTKWLLYKLKKVDSLALTDLDLIGQQGTVIVTIFENSVGSISLNTKVGKITYSARSTHTISQGTTIKIIDVVNHTVIVSDDLNSPLLTEESTLDIYNQ